MKNAMNIISNFVFYYPLLMAYLWMVGGLLHYLLIERRDAGRKAAPPLASYPKVSVVVPCYNEADNVREVIACLDQLNYPNYNIIAINDGSSDERVRMRGLPVTAPTDASSRKWRSIQPIASLSSSESPSIHIRYSASDSIAAVVRPIALPSF